MQEDIDLYLETAEESMQEAIERFKREMMKIRSGKANPNMLSSVMVDYYGAETPLNQVANIKVTDGRTLAIMPWEKGMLAPIEQAIFSANLGVTPQNDGTVVRIVIPPLTEERRRQMVKQVGDLLEQTKVSIRSARREAMEGIKEAVNDGYPEDAGKRMEEKAQGITDKHTKEAERLFSLKEKDIMTV